MSDAKSGLRANASRVLQNALGIEGVVGWDGRPCDADAPSAYSDGNGGYVCRCVVCARCGHHTGNSHQGRYWAWCRVTGTRRELHLCCPGDCDLGQ